MTIRNIELFEENIKHDLEVFRNNIGYVTDPEIIRGIIDYLKQ